MNPRQLGVRDLETPVLDFLEIFPVFYVKNKYQKKI